MWCELYTPLRSSGLRVMPNKVYSNKGRGRVRVNRGKGRVGVNLW